MTDTDQPLWLGTSCLGEIRNVTDGVVLTLKDDKIGTKLSATRAMHYGKMTVEMQTAWSGGVVTAAVLMGDTTEEVDVSLWRLAGCASRLC